MSKDNHSTNLRLLGSPVNITLRGKRKDDKKNIRNRPRSALQNSCITPEYQERYQRPYSADTKAQTPSTTNFLKSFTAELMQYNNPSKNIKVFPPTTDILCNSKSYNITHRKDKELCSNASDYGSEDTFVSLGTKIKARAQLSAKSKTQSNKNLLKYRNIAKKGKKMDEELNDPKIENNYDMEVKITEKKLSADNSDELYNRPSYSQAFRTNNYESYYVPLGSENTSDIDPLAGRVSFGSKMKDEMDEELDTYSRRLTLTKQQLSLVEEESTQDLESIQSQNLSSLSPENCEEHNSNKNNGKKHMSIHHNEYLGNVIDQDGEYKKMSQNFVRDKSSYETKAYKHFYDDFKNSKFEHNKQSMSSTMIHTDSSSKDSGYPDSASNDEKVQKREYSLPNMVNMNTRISKDENSSELDHEPKSLGSGSLTSRIDKAYLESSYTPDKVQYENTEPLNHSRLLYKNFFLRKEQQAPVVPQNSPNKLEMDTSTAVKEQVNDNNNQVLNNNLEYPTYLLNSSTKQYTSKVIEDYKKEIEAINNLHELTLKDIKTDAISPTPLNIDKMFEEHTAQFLTDSSPDSQDNDDNSNRKQITDKISSAHINMDTPTVKSDVSKMTTKELIQNYFKVKEGDYNKDQMPRVLKKFDRKFNNEENAANKKFLNNNNANKYKSCKSVVPVHIRNQTQKTMFTMNAPLSARIESVQNDKDIDSWMSLSEPSPTVENCIVETNDVNSVKTDDINSVSAKDESNSTKQEENVEVTSKVETDVDNNPSEVPNSEVKELHAKSTVLDIYSMLKEIESYGDNPVQIEKDDRVQNVAVENESQSVPKDNFMEIFEFLEKVEHSANEALSVVTSSIPLSIPKLEALLRLSQTELAQRLVTASLQLEERSCCIALLQESLANHKEQMIAKVGGLEKQSIRNVNKVKQECEEAIKRHQNFIDQLINDKKTLNHRIEQLVDERRTLEERWKRSAQTLEDRYKLELKNQHDKMAAAQQVARQRWVRQKAEKIKELTVKGLEGELREMAERQQREVSELRARHAEREAALAARAAAERDAARRRAADDLQAALLEERRLAAARMEKQILELELTYQEQRTRLVTEMRAENDRVASGLSERERSARHEIEKWREEQEKEIEEKKSQMAQEMAKEKERLEEEMREKRASLHEELERHKRQYEAEQHAVFKAREREIQLQHKQERDRAIEKAIECMEAEAQSGRKDLQDAMRRNKEQYEEELKELAQTEQATLKRYQDAQARIRQTEDKCADLEMAVNNLETRNKVLTEKNTQLEQRSEETRSACEDAWRSKVEALRKEMEDTRRTHEEQMHQLYAKVKVAVARKDSTIQALTREMGKSQEKITLLEQKLQQQRKDFLKHK